MNGYREKWTDKQNDRRTDRQTDTLMMSYKDKLFRLMLEKIARDLKG